MDAQDVLGRGQAMTKRQNFGKTDTVAALSVILLGGMALTMLALFILIG